MTEEYNSEAESREIEQKEIYIDCPDAETEPYKEQPQRKYEDKIVKGIAIGRGARRDGFDARAGHQTCQQISAPTSQGCNTRI